ncbi:MAG: DNA recombination protein RmuC [Acidobacteria bacterium]|nr:DNA recombination protein RmuC [Acidobacteriota bacterium]
MSVLAAALIFVGVAVLRRGRPRAPAADPAVPLLQQQVSRLAEQISQLGSQIPKEVGTALNLLMGQVGARLSENAQTLQKAASDTGRMIADVSVRLGELGRSSQQILELGQDIRGLQQIFQAPKIRGGLGELALESMLRQIFPAEHFDMQYAFSNGEKVDAVLRLPGGLVPIDSKFPLAGFRAILEAPNAEARQKAARSFGRDVRKHIDDIAEKYIRPGEGTLDYALMYIPAENVFYEVIARDEAAAGEEDINTYALKRRVYPVSPNSIHAHLQAIAFGLMGLRIEERAREIMSKLRQLHGDFETFQEAFSRGQKHLNNAQAAFSDAADQVNRLALQIDQSARVLDETPEKTPIRPRALER